MPILQRQDFFLYSANINSLFLFTLGCPEGIYCVKMNVKLSAPLLRADYDPLFQAFPYDLGDKY